jgi:hypothetical protein
MKPDPALILPAGAGGLSAPHKETEFDKQKPSRRSEDQRLGFIFLMGMSLCIRRKIVHEDPLFRFGRRKFSWCFLYR